jgi:hypothetical protein
MPRLRHAAVHAALLTALAACSGGSGGDTGTGPKPPAGDSVKVSLDRASAQLASLGDTLTLAATATRANGAPATVTLAWSAADATVLRSLDDGRFVALRNGTTDVQVQVAGSPQLRATAAVTVQQLPANASLTPATGALRTRSATQPLIQAAASDARGNAIANASWTWSVTGEASITPDVPGSARATLKSTGINPGPVTITARAGSATATATWSILPDLYMESLGAGFTLAPGATRQLALQARAVNGGATYTVPATWSSSNAAVASVDANGVVTARAVGTARITAASSEFELSAAVDVQVRQ